MFKSDMSDEQKEKLLHIIPRLTNIDEYVTASYINNSIKKSDKDLKLSRITSFYDRLIDELKTIYNLYGDEKETFQTILRNGMDHYNNGEYVKALDYFTIGAQKTKIPIFNYYAGKTLFNLKKYK